MPARLSLKQVRMIEAVAKAGGFAPAAAELNSTQPVVSRTVASAERLLGRTLFQRGWSGTEPTAMGEAVIRRCSNALNLIARAEDDLAARGGPRPNLTNVLRWHHLDAVASVAGCGSTMRAAAQLRVTQPAISRSISALAGHLPQPLFRRRRAGLEALPAARRLAALRDELHGALGTVEELSAANRDGLARRLAVGMLPFSGQDLIAKAFGVLTSSHPGMRLMAVPGGYAMLAEALLRSEIDCMIGILRGSAAHADLQETFLYHEKYTLVARHDHPCHGRRHSISSLKNEKWIVAPHGTPIRAFFESLFEREGEMPPAQTCEILSFGNAEQVIMNSRSIGLLAYSDQHLAALRPELRKLEIDLPGATVDIGLTARANTAVADVLDVFETTLRRFTPQAPASP